jgi:hypothetical protein
MGYDVHITRADDWTNNQNREISTAEWKSVIEADPELAFDPNFGENSVVWSSETAAPDAWLDWSEGNIYTTDPDRATVEKMLEIASRLDARVQGDEGKVFVEVTDWPA